MKRRDFIQLLGGTTVAWPIAVRAEQHPRKVPLIGWLVPGSQAAQANLEEFRRGMRELGYTESVTVETIYVYADGEFDRLGKLATMLVDKNVDVIVTAGTPGCLAAKHATSTIPVVFAVSSDPLSTGVVRSLAHPESNITGLSLMATDLSAKRMELLQVLLPSIRRIAVLWDSSNPGMALRVRETRQAAEQLKVAFLDVGARDLDSLETSFVTISASRPEALLVTAEAFTNLHRDRILEFVSRNHIPAIYEDGSFARAGGLIAYGPNVPDMFHRAATYVDKILKGAKPADLPVEQPTKFELVINLRTAKALSIEIPTILLTRADEVIE
jgi:putative tryptophan/tyrosine transport system substrate-binding protein